MFMISTVDWFGAGKSVDVVVGYSDHVWTVLRNGQAERVADAYVLEVVHLEVQAEDEDGEDGIATDRFADSTFDLLGNEEQIEVFAFAA